MNNRHFFAGANTHKGFVNLFDSIGGKYTYILKGCAGSGKSTLLKTIAEHFSNLGETIEFFHCSADPDSLDGILLVEHDIAIVDGTTPHIMESKEDGTDEIIYLSNNLPFYIPMADRLYSKKQKYYKKSAKLQKKAFEIHKKIEAIYAHYIEFDKITEITQELIAKLS